MQTSNHEQNPEDEVLEGIIIEPGSDTESEIFIDGAYEQNTLNLSQSEAPSDDASRRERLSEELHKDPDSIDRLAQEARGMQTNNLEEVTANLERMKTLLRGII